MGEIALSGNKNLKRVCEKTGMIGLWSPSEYVAITERQKVKLKAGAELWVCFPFGRCHLAWCPQAECGDHSRVEIAVRHTEVGSRPIMVALRFQWLRVGDVGRIHTFTGAFGVRVSLKSTVASQRSSTGCPTESKVTLKQRPQDGWMVKARARWRLWLRPADTSTRRARVRNPDCPKNLEQQSH